MLITKWKEDMVMDKVKAVQGLAERLDSNQEQLDRLFHDTKAQILQSKRIIACTTTAAAMNQALLHTAEADVVIVEEAGEILEAHVLTALAPTVKQLILIGDHKQLRPKINNYALSVDSGDGFDLNRSLFERLILQNHKHSTLRKQHRMHPEISKFARALTYPDLFDGPRVAQRDRIQGLQDRVIFINHDALESDPKTIRNDSPNTKASKENPHEAEMVLKFVKYLGQQGYKTEQIVVLTPYLGQLRLLRDTLARETDPVLGDFDTFEMIRAGLMTHAAAQVEKSKLRISTIDNYQGEESDIVIASLTRSNSRGDIGFMASPERLNVLLTRARCGMIMIGNMETFMRSKKGTQTWTAFFKLLKSDGHLYDGLPVKCERHPTKLNILQRSRDFEELCPEGGCDELCGTIMKCGKHKCPLRCHRVADHSNTYCKALVERTCDRGHNTRISCGKQSERCKKCIEEDEELERRTKRDLKLELDRQARQQRYRQELAQAEDEIDHQRRLALYRDEEEAEKKTLEQKKALAKRLQSDSKRLQKSASSNNQAVAQHDAVSNDPELQSEAKDDWTYLKKYQDANSEPLDELIKMIGLESVKQEFLNIKTKVDTTLRQGISLNAERFSCSLLGNPGTGKTTVARLYGKFLTCMGVLPGEEFKETTGANLAHGGINECKTLIDAILNEGGGVLFIDEAYQLTSGNNPGGSSVLDYLLTEVENLRGKVVFVLAGYNKQMESFFAHNPGIPSRFPIEMKFHDYTDTELLLILEQNILRKYSHRMKCEDGTRGLYCRIVARRIGYGRGKEGFGNARAVENVFAKITNRQGARLHKERRAAPNGQEPDDFLFTKQDLIGSEPASALKSSVALQRLQQLTGLGAVKNAVKVLVDTIHSNYDRELNEEPPVAYSLNKVFLGNPGTGKTTVAKIYGALLVELGLLSKSEDFVGAHLGSSEQTTKGILKAAEGKVLVIDEAYGLYGGDASQGGTSDPYRTAVIDTIVAEVQSVPGDDRCVLLLGYKDQLETMFQNVNPGLSRRFPMASTFSFEDFDDAQLSQVLDMKLKEQAFSITGQAREVVLEMLNQAKNRPHFGNAGEIDILLDRAKAEHQSRLSKQETSLRSTLEAVDFDKNFNRATLGGTNIRKLFEEIVGNEDVIKRLEDYQSTVRNFKAMKMEMNDCKEQIPFNFLFRGPPGTGKTTTARKVGKVFYDMGFLAKAEVIECSTTDIIGQYLGQTGPKVQQQLDKALGKVLFIDEAYRLIGDGYAREAMDKLVTCVTSTKYYKRLVIVLAGYEKDINHLMQSNPGLTSRFPEVIDFRGFTEDECWNLLVRLLLKQKLKIEKTASSAKIDLTSLQSPISEFQAQVREIFSVLIVQPGWASARDVETLAKHIFNKALSESRQCESSLIVISQEHVKCELQSLKSERKNRSQSLPVSSSHVERVSVPQSRPPNFSPQYNVSHSQTELKIPTTIPEMSLPFTTKIKPKKELHDDAQRDHEVSDETWQQLQLDKKADRDRAIQYQKLKKEAESATEERRLELIQKLAAEEKEHQKQAAIKAKLKAMGRCPVGYEWISQADGYRCAGGSHFMAHSEL